MQIRMMRISKHGTIIITLAASSALLAQSADAPVKSQHRFAVPDVRQIVDSSIAATQRHWQARLHYTYVEHDESRRRDLAGLVKSEDVDVSKTILVNGVPFELLVERNGRPPSAEEERNDGREAECREQDRRRVPTEQLEHRLDAEIRCGRTHGEHRPDAEVEMLVLALPISEQFRARARRDSE